MKWLDIEPYVAKKLRRANWGILSADVLLINQDVNASQLARRYVKIPATLSVLNIKQVAPYFLFHLSAKSPAPYKTAFELLFRDALFQTSRADALQSVQAFGAFMYRNKLPVPFWFWRLVLKEEGRAGACAYINLMHEPDLFRLAALYRHGVPDPENITYKPLRLSAQQEHDEAFNLFNTALGMRNDVWGTVSPVMFWTMVGDIDSDDRGW